MSLVVFKLNNPKKKELLNVNPDKLYQEVRKTGLPFFKWTEWLETYLSRSLVVREENRQTLIR